MLQLAANNTIREMASGGVQANLNNCFDNLTGSAFQNGLGNYQPYPAYQTIYWQSYPVYICTDKTKKAIEVLKHLQEQKLLTCNSVNKFIELVEQISNIL